MTQERNWRNEVTAHDFLLHQKKQLQLADRRPVIRKASDLVGPGIAATAVRITDFDDTLATFNGYFSAETGATNAPINDEPHVGYVISDAELGGIQQFTGLTSGIVSQRVFTRNPMDASAVYFGDWYFVTSP